MKNPILRFSQLLRFSLLLFLLLGSAQQSIAKESGLAAMQIYQKSALLGDCDVQVARDKLKVTLHRLKLVIYAQGPQWQVYTVNPAYKTVWPTSADKFAMTQQMTGNLYLYGLPSATKLPVKETTRVKDLNGLKC
jgi:hypothetical protein